MLCTDAIDRMRYPDMAALLLIAHVIGLVAAIELRDIKLVQLAVARRASSTSGWITLSLFVISATRQFALLPALSAVVPWMLLFRGSDAMSICFNAVAVA